MHGRYRFLQLCLVIFPLAASCAKMVAGRYDAAVAKDVDPVAACDNCRPWDSGWRFLSNLHNADYPRVDGESLILVPDNRYSAAAVAWLDEPLVPPYTVSFDYAIDDDDGGDDIWSTAHGVVLMLGKNADAYGTPPSGQRRGFVEDGTGYGVHLNVHGPRQVLLSDGSATPLAAFFDRGLYTSGKWRTVRVVVGRGVIAVYLDGALVIQWHGQVSTAYSRIGLGAASGLADGEHRVRRVRVKRLGLPEVVYASGKPSWRAEEGRCAKAHAPVEEIQGKGVSFCGEATGGALAFSARDERRFQPAEFARLSFRIRPTSDGGKAVAWESMALAVDNGSPGRLLSEVLPGIEPGQWQYAEISLSQLDTTGRPFSRIQLTAATSVGVRAWVDDVVLWRWPADALTGFTGALGTQALGRDGLSRHVATLTNAHQPASRRFCKYTTAEILFRDTHSGGDAAMTRGGARSAAALLADAR